MLATAGLALSSVIAQAGQGHNALPFDIQQQSMGSALSQFAHRTGLQVLFPADATEVDAPQITGTLTPQAALSQLLANTDLEYEFINPKTVAIRPTHGARQPPGYSSLAQANVSDATARASGGEKSGDIGRTANERAPVVEEVVVTGTHIRGVPLEHSPVKIYTREDIDLTGAPTVEEFIRKMPENFSSVHAGTTSRTQKTSGFNQGGANGFDGAGVNLRGMGPGASLVLVNGRRLSSAGSSGSFVDVSMIPLSAVERIEVLTDGASAVYGADAIAGVVNFVLRKDFAGAETTVRQGGATEGGAGQFTGSQLFGKYWQTGNALVTYEYDRQDGLLLSQRSYLPQKNGRDMLTPEQRRNSVFFSGRQELFGLNFSGDASYSDRDFMHDVFSGVVPTHVEGNARQRNATVEVSRGLIRDWVGKLSASYGATDQDSVVTTPTQSVTSRTDTVLRSASIQADGTIASLHGAAIKGAVGADFRAESLRGTGPGELKRDIASIYAEFSAPIVRDKRWAHRVEISLAGRYDHYSDAGSSSNPKVGILWSPRSRLNFRATYSTSFQPPLLVQLDAVSRYAVTPVPDPTAPGRMTVTLFDLSAGNADLKPETSTSITAGFDFNADVLAGLKVGATYFRTDFADRIATPPIVGSTFQIFSQLETLSPFVERSPSLQKVQDIYATGLVANPRNLPAEAVQAIFDGRLVNISSTKQSGVDLFFKQEIASRAGDFGFSFNGTYFLDMDYRPVWTVPKIELMNVVGEPMDLRFTSGVSWRRAGLGASLLVNYSDDYRNVLIAPPGKVKAWTTVDVQFSYESRSRAFPVLDGLKVTVDVDNVTNARPPEIFVTPGTGVLDVGFDPLNATPIGRFVAVQLRKSW